MLTICFYLIHLYFCENKFQMILFKTTTTKQGITIKGEDITESENWTNDNQIKKLVVFNEKNEKIGVIYLDLYIRNNKYTGSLLLLLLLLLMLLLFLL